LTSLSSARARAERATLRERDGNATRTGDTGDLENSGKEETRSWSHSVSGTERNCSRQVKSIDSISTGASRTLYEIKIKTLGKNLDTAGTHLQNTASKINAGSRQDRMSSVQNNRETTKRF
jgi:hypothetical protein